MLDALFYRSNAPRVFAADNVGHPLGQLQMTFLGQFSIFDNIDRDIRINIAKHMKIYMQRGVLFDNTFFPHLLTLGIFNKRH